VAGKAGLAACAVANAASASVSAASLVSHRDSKVLATKRFRLHVAEGSLGAVGLVAGLLHRQLGGAVAAGVPLGDLLGCGHRQPDLLGCDGVQEQRGDRVVHRRRGEVAALRRARGVLDLAAVGDLAVAPVVAGATRPPHAPQKMMPWHNAVPSRTGRAFFWVLLAASFASTLR
jgi:hypothetical protein